eukprot:TRINITY_DN9683_c0_g1_i6.p1 TRINITY_DN9683_c0_g1~~TRINITY_DN9683_c0_g1_i6.p1  ORF type:complete len:128 (+),score=14.94 TRINITY_DN9683_c0_g1_i6:73-456(+)
MLCAGKKSRFVQRDKVYAYIHTFNLTHHAPTSLFSRTRRDKMKIVEMLLNLFRCVDALNVVCGGLVPSPVSQLYFVSSSETLESAEDCLSSASATEQEPSDTEYDCVALLMFLGLLLLKNEKSPLRK